MAKYKDFVSSTGYGKPDGIAGINCRHSYSAFIPGVSTRAITDEELEQLHKSDNTPIPYKGREYDKSDALARQRTLERGMRAQRQKIKGLKDGKIDDTLDNDIILARANYQRISQEYREFSRAMDLPEQRQRVTIDGLGSIGKGKVKVDNSVKGGIIKVKTVKEAKEKLVSKVGFTQVESSFDVLDNDLILSNTNQLIKLEEKFNAIHKSTSTISANSIDSSTVAYVSSSIVMRSKQNLSLSPKYYKDKKEFLKTEKRSVETGFSMPVNLSDEELSIATVTHEYGHLLQNILIEERMKSLGWESNAPRAFVNEKRKTQQARYKWYYNVAKEVQQKCAKEIVEIAGRKNQNFSLKDNISRYGMTNAAEFFAEVFANSQLSKPNELGNAMNTWLKERGVTK